MPTCATQPSLERTRAVADILFTQFARQRFNQAGVEDEQLLLDREEEEELDGIAQNLDYSSDNFRETSEDRLTRGRSHDIDRLVEARPILASYGRELRRIAEQFEQTRLRQQIKMRANEVQLKDIHRESFTQLLEELFIGGITRERVVILFFFCTDVALKAVSLGSDLVSTLLKWSLTFIKDRVCLWVHKIGGWDAVLCSYVPSMLVTAAALLGICALTIYIKKNLWS